MVPLDDTDLLSAVETFVESDSALESATDAPNPLDVPMDWAVDARAETETATDVAADGAAPTDTAVLSAVDGRFASDSAVELRNATLVFSDTTSDAASLDLSIAWRLSCASRLRAIGLPSRRRHTR